MSNVASNLGPAPGNPPPRNEWLRQLEEPAIEPGLAIIDAHHHLWQVPFPYQLGEILADIASGHDVRATVFVDCKAMYRESGPGELQPVGEVEFANGIAAMSASGGHGPARVSAAIVGHADLSLGRRVEPVLASMRAAAPTRFRGIRHITAHDAAVRLAAPEHLLLSPSFQAGFGCLQDMGLSFDAWLYHPQLSELTALMEAFPDARMVINHIGGRIGVGRYAGMQEQVWRDWHADMARLARFPNVHVKLGGLGMNLCGFHFYDRPAPPSSDDLQAAWQATFEALIDLFGAERCMLESNFPVDKASCSYGVLWNAFKKITTRYSAEQRHQLFFDTARRFYNIEL